MFVNLDLLFVEEWNFAPLFKLLQPFRHQKCQTTIDCSTKWWYCQPNGWMLGSFGWSPGFLECGFLNYTGYLFIYIQIFYLKLYVVYDLWALIWKMRHNCFLLTRGIFLTKKKKCKRDLWTSHSRIHLKLYVVQTIYLVGSCFIWSYVWFMALDWNMRPMASWVRGTSKLGWMPTMEG